MRLKIFLLLVMIARILPYPTFFADGQKIYEQAFAAMPRIVLGSMAAYLISQLHDVWAYQYWKGKVRHIWVRNNASTIVSQLIDSVIFTFAAFAGTFPMGVLLEIVISTYLLKVIVAIVDTPFIYLARWMKTKGVVDRS